MKKTFKLLTLLLLIVVLLVPSIAFAFPMGDTVKENILVSNSSSSSIKASLVYGGDKESIINLPSTAVKTLEPTDENSYIDIVDPDTFDVDKEGTIVESIESSEIKLDENTDGILMLSAKEAMSIGYKFTINSQKESVETLKANKYYFIRVKAKSINGAKGHIHLFTDLATIEPWLTFDVNSDSKNEAVISNVEPGNGWVEYDYLIKTAEKAPKTVELELWLGDRANENPSTGTVIFDQVQVYEIASETLYNHYCARSDNENKSNVTIIDGPKYFFDIDGEEKVEEEKKPFDWSSLGTGFFIGFSTLAMSAVIIVILVKKGIIKVKKHTK